MEEVWKDIRIVKNGIVYNYAEKYQISNFGRIKNNNGCLLKHKIKNNGYEEIGLRNGKKQFFLVHRLVAETFLDNPNNLLQVNHKDGNKNNNNINNLEWCTCKENVIHSIKNKLRVALKGKEHYKSKPILQYSLDGIFIKRWVNAMEIKDKLKYDNSSINKCCKGKYKQSHNYIWKYEDTK